MKKILLVSTALVGVMSFFNHAANAQGPTVSLGGFADFQAGWTDQKDAFKTGPFTRDYHTRSDTEIHVNVNGKTDSGLGYGAVVELEADVTPADDNSGFNADKTYLFLESGIGRFELGSNTDAARSLKVDASTFARATGGIDGDWYYFANTGGSTGLVSFITRPDLPTAHAKGVTEDANKVTYYTPRMSGFQAGVSFTPDQGEVGTATGFSGNTNGNYKNVINAGLNYTGQYDQVSFAGSLTGEFGPNELSTVEDLRAFALGANVGFAGFTVGGSYGDWDNSNQLTATSDNAHFWDIGGAYETGPYAVSVTYIDSTFASNDFHNLSIGTDYKLAPGLTPYVEANFFKLDEAGTAVDNEGTVVLVGTQLNF